MSIADSPDLESSRPFAPRPDGALFGPVELRELIRTVGLTSLVPGEPVLHEGAPVTRVGIVVSGSMELVCTPSSGRRVVLQVLRSGDIFGDIPLLCRTPLPFTVRALQAAEVVLLDSRRFWGILEHRPDVTQRLLFSVASRLERSQHRLLELTAGDLAHRVARVLLDHTGGQPGNLDLTQTTLAELVDASRQGVNATLKAFEADGAVKLAYRCIEVIAPERLPATLP